VTLSALDPGKQGLKPDPLGRLDLARFLSALDPGKQGLKQPAAHFRVPGQHPFSD